MKARLAALCLLTAATGAQAQPAPSVLVTTVMPRQGSLPDRIEAYGVAVPATDATQTLSLPQEGRVRRILRAPGEAVRRGDVILEWEASALARQGWDQARTALLLAQQQQAHAALLLARHLGTRDQFDQAAKSRSDAQAALDALRLEGADRPVRAVLAPFDGTLVAVPVAQGDRIAAGAVLATLARRDGIVVTVGVDQARLAALHPGQPATVQALSGGALLAATVLRVDATLDPHTRLVDVDLSISSGTVLPGADMRAEISVGQLSGWLVPHDAVLQDADGLHLFQAASGHAALVRVTLAGVQGDTDILSGPVLASRPIILNGAAQLGDGASLRLAPTP